MTPGMVDEHVILQENHQLNLYFRVGNSIMLYLKGDWKDQIIPDLSEGNFFTLSSSPIKLHLLSTSLTKEPIVQICEM